MLFKAFCFIVFLKDQEFQQALVLQDPVQVIASVNEPAEQTVQNAHVAGEQTANLFFTYNVSTSFIFFKITCGSNVIFDFIYCFFLIFTANNFLYFYGYRICLDKHKNRRGEECSEKFGFFFW